MYSDSLTPDLANDIIANVSLLLAVALVSRKSFLWTTGLGHVIDSLSLSIDDGSYGVFLGDIALKIVQTVSGLAEGAFLAATVGGRSHVSCSLLTSRIQLLIC
jgi:hypothetical protein